MRFVLLQARNPGDDAQREEHLCFAQRLGVAPEDIVGVNVVVEDLHPDLLDGVDVLLVGGAGEYSVLDREAHIIGYIDFLAEIADGRVPIFASCFGFQALVLGLGGEVIRDEDNSEVGTYALSVTDAGRSDPLFGGLPGSFDAQLGHKDRASRMPKGVETLISSERCPHQAFRIARTQVVATQFHPELTDEDNKARFRNYMGTYGKLFGEEEAQRKHDSHRPSPEANALIRRFVDGLG